MESADNIIDHARDQARPMAYLAATYAFEDTCYAAADRPRLLAEVRHHRNAAQRYIRFVIGSEPGSMVVGPSEAFYDAAAARDGPEAERCLQREIERLYARLAARMTTITPDEPGGTVADEGARGVLGTPDAGDGGVS